MLKKNLWIIFLILLLQIVLRVPYLNVPLERDEGAYGYIAKRMIAGDMVYRDAIDHKPPLIYITYAAIIKSCGDSIVALRSATLVYGLLTTLSIFAVGYLWLGMEFGLVASLLYALFSGGPIVQGALSNTEVFMVLPLVLSLLFFFLNRRKSDFWCLLLSGVFAGAAVLFKQTGGVNFIVLLPFVFDASEDIKINAKNILIFVSGVLILPLLFAVYFLFHHIISDAFFCTVMLNKEYLAALPGTFIARLLFGLDVIRSQMLLENGVMWILSLSALAFVFIKDRSKENMLIALWFIVPLLAIFLSGRFFGHYFIQFLPALALLSAYAIKKIWQNSNFYLGVVIMIALVFLFVNAEKYQLPFCWTYSFEQISTQMYGSDEFVSSYYLANELKKSLKPDDTVFVWSANPEIYYYLDKKAPTKYFNYLTWMQNPDRDAQIFNDLKNNVPTYFIKSSYSIPDKAIFKFALDNYRVYLSVGDCTVYKRIKI